MMLTVIPMAYAQTSNAAPHSAQPTASAPKECEDIYPLYEIVEKRDEYTKHFLMSDGSINAYIYSDQVHYLEENAYEEIDNSLIEKESRGNKYYTNNIASRINKTS